MKSVFIFLIISNYVNAFFDVANLTRRPWELEGHESPTTRSLQQSPGPFGDNFNTLFPPGSTDQYNVPDPFGPNGNLAPQAGPNGFRSQFGVPIIPAPMAPPPTPQQQFGLSLVPIQPMGNVPGGITPIRLGPQNDAWQPQPWQSQGGQPLQPVYPVYLVAANRKPFVPFNLQSPTIYPTSYLPFQSSPAQYSTPPVPFGFPPQVGPNPGVQFGPSFVPGAGPQFGLNVGQYGPNTGAPGGPMMGLPPVPPFGPVNYFQPGFPSQQNEFDLRRNDVNDVNPNPFIGQTPPVYLAPKLHPVPGVSIIPVNGQTVPGSTSYGSTPYGLLYQENGPKSRA